MRFLIPNINFIQKYKPNTHYYDFEKNMLNVFLPSFQEYAKVFTAEEAHSLLFSDFSADGSSFSFSILQSRLDEIIMHE